jgi:hypothetical protein
MRFLNCLNRHHQHRRPHHDCRRPDLHGSYPSLVPFDLPLCPAGIWSSVGRQRPAHWLIVRPRSCTPDHRPSLPQFSVPNSSVRRANIKKQARYALALGHPNPDASELFLDPASLHARGRTRQFVRAPRPCVAALYQHGLRQPLRFEARQRAAVLAARDFTKRCAKALPIVEACTVGRRPRLFCGSVPQCSVLGRRGCFWNAHYDPSSHFAPPHPTLVHITAPTRCDVEHKRLLQRRAADALLT